MSKMSHITAAEIVQHQYVSASNMVRGVQSSAKKLEKVKDQVKTINAIHFIESETVDIS